jgi:hypothetical protein
MPGQFEALPGGGAAVALDEVEISIIRSLAVQLLELIGPGPAEDADDDPLAELFAEGPSEPPKDPVLQRLFPDAYSDPEGTPSAREAEEQRAYSSEFRRFTGEGGAVPKLSAEDSRHWLGCLNDLRLAIGSRLDVVDEEDTDLLYRLPDEDPRKPMVMAYLWLGGLQDSLVTTLMP